MMSLSLRLRLLLAAVGLFVVGLAVGWQTAVDGPDAAGLKPPRDDWAELGTQTTDTAKLIKDLDQHSLWGEGGPAATGPSDAEKAEAEAKAKSEWRLSGIVDLNGKSWAVIMTPGVGKAPPSSKSSKIGDELPDGSKLVAIAKTQITVADAKGQQRQVKMFLPN
jgi:hypothetical protein